MFCTHCGASNPDAAAQCEKCGQTLSGPPPLEVVPNYLVQAILVTVCCCVPFGIPAIVYAAQVNSKIAAKDWEGARQSSRLAKTWCWVAFGCGIVVGIIYLFLSLLGAFADHSR
jgi:hypothetical protein